MLTGFNTDIEYESVTYHVQTEDRRGTSPHIESLVYVKGEILAARRTGYGNLLEAGAENNAIQALMERQHFAIVEAIRRGRIHLLMEPEVSGEGDTTVSRPPAAVPAAQPVVAAASPQAGRKTLDEVIADWLAEQDQAEGVRLEVDGGDRLQFGVASPLRVFVRSSAGGTPVQGATVLVRFLSTSARPAELAVGQTNGDGRLDTTVTIPPLEKGTGLVVVSVQHARGSDEAKFLVHR